MTLVPVAVARSISCVVWVLGTGNKGTRKRRKIMNKCSFCGTDSDEFPEHIEECPECGGKLHVGEDGAVCEGCGYSAFEVYSEGITEDHYLLIG